MEIQRKKKRKTEESDSDMTFGEHLEELRRLLFRVLLVFVVIFLLLFTFFGKEILEVVFYPSYKEFITNKLLAYIADITGIERLLINENSVNMFNNRLSGQFMLHIKSSLVASLILCFPYIILQLWKFVRPALDSDVRKKCRGLVWEVVLWFFLGTAFSYFIIAPIAINFLANYEANVNISNIIDVNSYLSTVLGISLSGGLIFQLPLLVRLLSSIGLITSEWMKRNRKIAIIALLIISAFITPPDIMSQCLLFIPFYILYEYSISVARRIEKNNE